MNVKVIILVRDFHAGQLIRVDELNDRYSELGASRVVKAINAELCVLGSSEKSIAIAVPAGYSDD